MKLSRRNACMVVLCLCLMSIGLAIHVQARAADSIRIASFNIRMFPCNNECNCLKKYGFEKCYPPHTGKTDLDLVAQEIRSLDADILGVQEILDTATFRRLVRHELGSHWDFVYADTPKGGPQKVGFLSNTRKVERLECRQIEGVVIKINPWKHAKKCVKDLRLFRPAIACRFRVLGGNFTFWAVVVHLKSGPCSSVRQAQWKIMEGESDKLAATDRDIIILGDFNDWKTEDRDCDAFRKAKAFTLVSVDLKCSFLFRGRPSPLDHIMVSESLKNALRKDSFQVGGPAVTGCTVNRRWKCFWALISDHCPVMIDIHPSGLRND